MKDTLRQLVAERPGAALDPRNVIREYLQARILESLQRSGAMTAIAFHGGTALRFLFRLPRFSEDLDFTLEHSERGFDIRQALDKVRSRMTAEGYRVDLRVKVSKAVHSGLVKFPGLLHELGYSPHRDEALRVKLEVDTLPPRGARCESTLIRRHVTLRLYHHDRASLLSGKLHAVLQRPWPKGRDLFDLFWYLSDPEWPAPNLPLLNNALIQTGWQGDTVTADAWRSVLRGRVQSLDWDRAMADLRPFIEHDTNAELLTRENLLGLL